MVVIGEDLCKGLFGAEYPIGKSIELNGHDFEVVGVMAKPSASFPGQEDVRALLPYFSMRKMFPSAKENMLVIISHPGKLPAALDETAGVLRQERRVPYSKPNDFWISSGDQMVEDFHKLTAIVALVMIVLSSIGLLVGGIGVMNIMLVSVTERSEEHTSESSHIQKSRMPSSA